MSVAIRRLYPTFDRKLARGIGRFIRENTSKIVATAMREFGAFKQKAASVDPWELFWQAEFGEDAIKLYGVAYETSATTVLKTLAVKKVASVNSVAAQKFIRAEGFKLATSVSASLKPALQGVIARGLRDEIGIDGMRKALKKRLKTFRGFELERLARTESVNALNSGALLGMEDSEFIKEKQWITRFDDRTSDVCEDLANQTQPLKQTFKSGFGNFQHPPAHPNCRSSVAPVI